MVNHGAPQDNHSVQWFTTLYYSLTIVQLWSTMVHHRITMVYNGLSQCTIVWTIVQPWSATVYHGITMVYNSLPHCTIVRTIVQPLPTTGKTMVYNGLPHWTIVWTIVQPWSTLVYYDITMVYNGFPHCKLQFIWFTRVKPRYFFIKVNPQEHTIKNAFLAGGSPPYKTTNVDIFIHHRSVKGAPRGLRPPAHIPYIGGTIKQIWFPPFKSAGPPFKSAGPQWRNYICTWPQAPPQDFLNGPTLL